MKSFTITEAREQLSELMDAALRGEEVIITKEDSSSIQLIPNTIVKPRPKFGSAKGLIKMSNDFDDPLEDFQEYM